MKKTSLVGTIRYLGNVVIVMQGLVIVLLTIFFINRQYLDTWRNYPKEEQAVTIYLKNISSERQSDVKNYLLGRAEDEGLFVVRRDLSLKNDGSFGGYKIGVYGNTKGNEVSLSFLNQQIMTQDNIDRLLASENQNSTLGVDIGSIDSLGKIPGFRFCERVVVKQLTQIFSDSETVNGTYAISGLRTPEQRERFLNGLSEAGGMSVDELLAKTSGISEDSSFMRDILFVFLVAQIFLNLIFFLATAVKNLPKQGKLVLLGWSKSAFVGELFGSFLTAAVIALPILTLAGYVLSGWKGIAPLLLSYFALAAVVNLLLVGTELAVASVVILLTKPLDAIHGRIPKRPLYVLGILAYLFISAGIVFCGSYVDQPLLYLSENAKLSKRWQSVSDYQILRSIVVGQDADSLSGQSKQLDQDIYDWYSSIAGQDGVYLVQTEYYDSDVLSLWSNSAVYSATPEKPFWYFTVSPNYLSKLGIELEEEALAGAKEGIRLYLLPSTFSDSERAQMTAWLEESSVRGISGGDIQTKFTKEQKFAFLTYEPDQELFTWATDAKSAMTEAAPVIYVATPENMRYFETESLRAAGMDGYIKFADEQTMQSCTQEGIQNQFHLSDNEVTFAAVQNYIDGLQKDIWVTIAWFGLVFVILLLILIGLLLTLAEIFRIANQERIHVKKFLGFSFWQLYRAPVLLLSGVMLAELLLMLILHSRFGFLLMILVSLLQAFIFVKYMARSELKRLLLSFKGE